MTILHSAWTRAAAHPERPLFTFLGDDGRAVGTLNHGELVRAADMIAGHLLGTLDLSPGDRVILAYPPGLDFVTALLGCMRAGLVPVPVCPPTPTSLAYDIARLSAMATSSRAKGILTNREYQTARRLMAMRDAVRHVLSGKGLEWPDLPWHTTDQLKPSRHPLPPLPAAAPDDLAFLQYTSGSTSFPKGVRITYGNLDHQFALNRAELGLGPEAHSVMWVPHFHDFGLISGILSAVSGSGQLTFMSPVSFIRRPALWLEVLSRVGATHTAAPTFAYDLAVRKTTPAERAALNLASLRVAMAAAEPVRANVVQAFCEAFAPAGFKPEAFCPAFGLAEHTVGVTTFGKGIVRVDRAALELEGRVVPDDAGSELVACGQPAADVVVRVVDPATATVCPPGRVGEIWVDSPSKADGYDGLPDESRETFQAPLEGRHFLRTGDLGFLHDGQLYITGRLKDLIIVRGRNLYPQDLEASVTSCHEAIRPGGVAAFAVPPEGDGGEERVVVFLELRGDKLKPGEADALAKAARLAVLGDHQIPCHAVVIGAAGFVPRTTSGKVRRQDCRKAFLDRSAARDPLHRHTATFEAEARVPAAPIPAPTPGDWLAIDDAFNRVVAGAGQGFARMARKREGRVFHLAATTLKGELRVLDQPEIPASAFFTPGRTLPVLVRHANGVQDDDAAIDNRGATVRVLDPATPDRLDLPLLDLLLTTGECFLQGTAEGFARWMAGSPEAREAIARTSPHIAEAAWGMMRQADSFTTLHYYGKVASHFYAADGSHHYVRFRLLAPAKGPDIGQVDRQGRALPPDGFVRAPGDPRAATFLHDDLQTRLAQGPVRYVLQAQLKPADEDTRELALDCTRPWAEPWRDVAELSLASTVDDEAIRPLRFNPRNAPAELAMVLARTPGETASLNHLRAIVYEIAACARAGEPLPADIQALMGPAAPAQSSAAAQPNAAAQSSAAAQPNVAARPNAAVQPNAADRPAGSGLSVCVVGAGAAGLSAARALERAGHRVTVLEREPRVAGKCASIEIDGRWYDLGGHICSPNYKEVAKLAAELGIETEAGTPGRLYDIETRTVGASDADLAFWPETAKFLELRRTELAGLERPGVAEIAPALGVPAAEWLAARGLARPTDPIAIAYTASGYGYVADPELPALAFLKFAQAMAGAGATSALPKRWTIKGGFARLWEAVARELADVRLGVEIHRIERRGGQVHVHTDGGELTFDRLVVATPLQAVDQFLDVTPDEAAIFGRIRSRDYYTTVATVTGLPRDGFYLVPQTAVGHSVAFHHRYPGSDVYLFYAYGDANVDGAAIERKLAEDVARMGGSLEKIHLQRRWDYHPHFSASDTRAGLHARLEALQGTNSTHYVGGLFDFELVECNVAYASALVARGFAPDTGLLAWLTQAVMEELRLPKPPAPGDALLELGLSSLQTVALLDRFTRRCGRPFSPAIFLDYPTLAELARHLDGPAPTVAAPVQAAPGPRRRVCVIGGGASGLTAAYRLEQLGHAVTVLERAPEVGGKCDSLFRGPHAYDWGGHFCSDNYVALGKLVAELGVETEPAFPAFPFDITRGKPFAAIAPEEAKGAWLRYLQARDRDFPSLTRPGLAGAAGALARPVGEWLAANNLEALGQAFGLNYTGSGYGYLSDPELPALYFLKGVQMIVGAAPGSTLPPAWTIKGGFLKLWQRVASQLRDVRRNVVVERVERDAAGVRVHTADGVLAFDELVVASPLHGVPGYLDATAEERAVFERVRHFDYYTTVIRAEGLPTDGFHLIAPHAAEAGKPGHSVAIHHRYPGDDVFLCYAYGDAGVDGEAVKRLLAEDVAKAGGRLLEVLDQRKWAYFPHFRSTDVAAGVYERLEALQGRNRTYYAGSLFNFELVDCNVAYAGDLVERFFTARAPVPAAGGLALVRAAVAQELGREPAPDASFLELGLDSMQAVSLISRLAEQTGQTLSPAILLDYPTVAELAAWLDRSGVLAPEPVTSVVPAAPEGRLAANHLACVHYSERDGSNQLLDIFAPRGRSNGLAIVDVVSATWTSGEDVLHYHLRLGLFEAFCAHGFTVFAVRPGSLPRFDGLEQVEHVRRAVRWVKIRAGTYGIDPERIALFGASSGAHLATLAMLGGGDAAVAALVALCPILLVTDDAATEPYAPLVNTDYSPGGRSREERMKLLSPLQLVTGPCPPTLIFHPLRDPLVPYSHSVEFAAALRRAGGRADLVPRGGDKHEYDEAPADFPIAAAWLEHVLTGRGQAPDLKPHSPAEPRSLFASVRPTPRLRLFCFHAGGGDASLFDGWADALPREVEVRAVQLPGRGERRGEAPFTEFKTLIDALVAAIAREDDRPFAFFGHSLGALIAFEVARGLRRVGRRLPSHLFVSAFAGPQPGDRGRPLSPQEIAAATAGTSPELLADLVMSGHWVHQEEAPLDLPITAFGARRDALVGLGDLSAWERHTTAAFDRLVFEGDHFYLDQHAPCVITAIAERLEAVGRYEATLREFAARWRSAPASVQGPIAIYDLAQIARAADADGKPLLPEALAALLDLVPTLVPSPLGSSDFGAGAACANTLLRWGADPGAIRAAIAHALAGLAKLGSPPEITAHQPYAPGMTIDESNVRWMLPLVEARLLLASAGDLLDPGQRRAVETLVATLEPRDTRETLFGRGVATSFDQSPLMLVLAEFFPEAELQSASAAAHVQRHGGLIGALAPATARYAELTGDAKAREALRALLARPKDGLWPGFWLPELVFSLYYMANNGLDVRGPFAPELERLAALLDGTGVGATGGVKVPDCDTTAVALAAAHRAGLAVKTPTAILDGFWSESRQCYLSHENQPVPYSSTEAHVAEAYLLAPDIALERKREIWQRTVSILESRPLRDGTNLSPFYAWESMISLGFRHAGSFPRDPATFHHLALDHVLAGQQADGGFCSLYTGASNDEETSYAVLSMRAALEALPPGPTRTRVEAAVDRARAYLAGPRSTHHPALVLGKVLHCTPLLIEALVLTSLAPMPVRAEELVAAV